MDLSSTSKTIQDLLHEIQSYVFDFNVHQQSINLSPAQEDSFSDLSSFPGLRGHHSNNQSTAGNTATAAADKEHPDTAEKTGINEMLMLQQRTVLQVSLIFNDFSLC